MYITDREPQDIRAKTRESGGAIVPEDGTASKVGVEAKCLVSNAANAGWTRTGRLITWGEGTIREIAEGRNRRKVDSPSKTKEHQLDVVTENLLDW